MHADLTRLPLRGKGGAFHVVVESPRGSTVKLKLEHFFTAAVAFTDKALQLLGWEGTEATERMVEQAAATYAQRAR